MHIKDIKGIAVALIISPVLMLVATAPVPAQPVAGQPKAHKPARPIKNTPATLTRSTTETSPNIIEMNSTNVIVINSLTNRIDRAQRQSRLSAQEAANLKASLQIFRQRQRLLLEKGERTPGEQEKMTQDLRRFSAKVPDSR